MHHDPQSARELAGQTSTLQAVIWLLVLLLIAFVLALALRNRDAQERIKELEESTDLLSKRVSECERVLDTVTDLEKRVNGVEAQFWE